MHQRCSHLLCHIIVTSVISGGCIVTYVFVISASVDIYVVHSDSVVKLHSDMSVTLSSASIH